MILDYCGHGDLAKAIIQCGMFEENIVKFYMAELIIAIGIFII